MVKDLVRSEGDSAEGSDYQEYLRRKGRQQAKEEGMEEPAPQAGIAALPPEPALPPPTKGDGWEEHCLEEEEEGEGEG